MNNTSFNSADELRYSEEIRLDFRKKFIRKRSNAVGFTVAIAYGVMQLISVLVSVIMLVLNALGFGWAYDINFANFVNELIVVVGFTVPFWVCAVIVNGSVSNTVKTEKVGFAEFAGFTLLVFGFNALCNYSSAILKNIMSSFGVEPVGITHSGFTGTENLAITLICSAVLPALIEEFAFRGVVLGVLRRSMNDISAIIVSSVLFAVIHGNLQQLPFAFGMGLVFAVSTVFTKSIYPAVIGHFLNNACAVILSDDAVTSLGGNGANAVSLMFYVISTASLVLGIILICSKKKEVFKFSSKNNDISVGQSVKISLLSPGMILVYVIYGLQILALQLGII